MAVIVALATACGSQHTGGELVSFHAYASGLATATATLDFDTGAAFHVQLTQARMHIGAVYMTLGQVGLSAASCVGETTYGLQVPGPVDVDVLSPRLQEFSLLGNATTDLNQSAQVWLADGDINRLASTTVVASVAGVATKAGTSYPFRGSITISQNRVVPPANPAEPGENPICKQRIITPIPVAIAPFVGGDLLLRIDPRPWLDGVDFSTLQTGEDLTTYVIPDATGGSGPDVAAGRAFFSGVSAASTSVYQFSWFVP